MGSSSDDRLLRKAVSGDREALGDLLQEYRPYLRILARRQLDSAMNARVDASDIVQQTCLEAHRDFAAFHGTSKGELINWLRRILEHNALESIQRHIVTQKRSISQEVSVRDSDGAGLLLDGVAGTGSSPSQRAMRTEHSLRVAAEIEALPEDQREAVRLRHLEGWHLSRLAQHFQRSESAVAGLVKRGLQSLRVRLADISKESIG
jgi:RNA polymerase sigma-70 factor (ECF subfamily)